MSRPLFKPSTEAVLERSLNAMTLACEAQKGVIKQLEADNQALRSENARLHDRLLTNPEEKE